MNNPQISEKDLNKQPKTLPEFYAFYRQFYLMKPNKEFTKEEQADEI